MKSEPPKAYKRFVEQYPKIGEAWGLLAEASQEGPLDAKTCRLIKLAMAIAAQKEGAVHSSTRKSLDIGVTKEELEQVVSLAPSVIGLSSTVAAHCWVLDVLDKQS